MQDDRVRALENGDRHAAPFAFFNQSRRRIETSQVVQQAGAPSFVRVFAMPRRQAVGESRDPDHVAIALFLAELFAHGARQFDERQRSSAVSVASSACSSAASRCA